MLERNIISIDLGKSGAAVEYHPYYKKVVSHMTFDNHTAAEIMRYLVCRRDRAFVVEEVKAAFGDGVDSAFTFGIWCGFILKMLDAFSIQYSLVSPQRWSAAYRKLYGNIDDFRTTKRRNEQWLLLHYKKDLSFAKRKVRHHSGIVDAILLADFFTENYDMINKKEKEEDKAEEEKKKLKKSKPGKVPKASYI